MGILNGKTAVVTGSTSGTGLACARAPSNRFQLDLAEDNGLANALRIRDELFSSDVLPADAKLMAPSDFYAATALRPSRTRPTAGAERARRFPYLAA
ncbi:hypothetical protein [Bradyrhizobium sp. CCBAU 51627]|uniref:hypothetical protein n=1 Tax=Bradyrhizobium sp. CCBAU 51627 TaxID=1325088 RepID=UPI002305D546|nr:hypothetical protein [Bradyrhizobium sp. CCBAU 51627]MDA9430223.1 hypothetical protein [Bradyrhizobium sp. CCBAU 51627]